MKKSLKRIVIVASIAIIFVCLVSVAYAAGSFKKVEAWFGVTIMYNNQQLTSNVEPFIVDGSTYVPLRMIMNSFDKDITWDSANNKVMIFDKPSSTEISLRSQLAQRDMTISDLQAKLRKYESSSSSSSHNSSSLDDMEDELNDDYEDYENKDFEISLSGDNDDIEVRVDVSSSQWSDLTSSKQTKLLQDICDDIENEFEDAEIEGYVRSSSSSSRLIYFYYASNKVVRTNGNESWLDFEKDLDREYHDCLDDEDIPAYITVSGSESNPIIKVNVDYNRYDDEWRRFEDQEIRNVLINICDTVKRKYSGAYVDIYVYDTYNSRSLAYFYRSTTGTDTFTRNVK